MLNKLEELRMQFRTITGEIRALVEIDELSDEENDLLLEKRKAIDVLRVKIDAICGEDTGGTRSAAYGAWTIDEQGRTVPMPGLENATSGPVEDRSYAGMFSGEVETNEWGSFAEFAFKVAKNLPDARMQRSLQEATPSDGGFAVPTAYASEIFDVALQSEVVRPRAKVYSVGQANKLIVPATVIGDHSSNLYGGVTVSWTSEGGTMTGAEPAFRDIELTPYKATALYVGSSEWFSDAVNANGIVTSTMSGALGWNLDKVFLKGAGVGQPLGVLGSDCVVEVAKESGQTADTVVSGNIFKMWAAMHPACHKKSVWVIHPDVLPQLFSLSLSVGTGGSAWFVPAGGASPYNTLLGRPIVVSEHSEPLGDAGDILLADFSQYAIGMRKELSIDSSQHVYFTTDKITFRGIVRVDGQPMWDEALTLADGSKTVSPFVTLADRA